VTPEAQPWSVSVGADAGGGAAAQPGAGAKRVVLLGHSVKGRAIKALRLGDPSSRRKALIVGVIHGDETAGLGVIRELRRRWAEIHGVDLWTIYSVNPDGMSRGTRRNATGSTSTATSPSAGTAGSRARAPTTLARGRSQSPSHGCCVA